MITNDLGFNFEKEPDDLIGELVQMGWIEIVYSIGCLALLISLAFAIRKIQRGTENMEAVISWFVALFVWQLMFWVIPDVFGYGMFTN